MNMVPAGQRSTRGAHMFALAELIQQRFKFNVAILPDYPDVAYRDKSDPSDANFIDVLMGYRYLRWDNHQYYPGPHIEVDRPDAVSHIRRTCGQLNLPRPWIIENPENGHAHAIWFLRRHILKLPVGEGRFGDHKGNSCMNYLRDVQAALTVAFGGDLDYHLGAFSRNSFHKDHVTYEGECPDGHDLSEFVHICRDFRPPRKFVNNIDADHLMECESREGTMFQTLRFWAYQHAHGSEWIDQDEWESLLTEEAMTIFPRIAARPASGEPHSYTWGQAMVSVRSIARWMSREYQYYQQRPMHLDRSLNRNVRIRMGQSYAAGQRRGRNSNNVITARKANPKATQREIAQTTKLSLSTVKRHWHSEYQNNIVDKSVRHSTG
jgi:hypothetical protein